MSIGGRASNKGITFTSQDMSVRAGAKGDYARALPKAQSGFIKKIGRIPFLRGLTLFTQPGMLIILALMIANDALTLSGIDIDSGISDGTMLIIFAAVLLVIWIIQRLRGGSIKALRRYHAAEHMAINTFEAGKPLTAENVKAALRTHTRCGTNLAAIFLIIGVPVICIFPYGFCLLITICVSYEIFLALPKYKFLRPFFSACLWLQYHITTAQPGDKEIEVAVRGLKRLTEN